MSKTYTYTLNKEYSLQYTGFTVSSLISRGFTGHEHLDNVQLINMNGRLYDPIIARFLSPDNNIQMPDYTQNLNRYSYALNNPLIYTDPDGEFIGLAAFGLFFVGDLISNLTNGKDDPVGLAYRNATNTLNGLNNCLQVPIYNDGNTHITAGISPLAMGISFNASQTNGNVTTSVSGGIGAGGWFAGGGVSYTSGENTYGINGGGGSNYWGVGGSFTHKGYGVGYTYTHYGNETIYDGKQNSQNVGGVNIYLDEVSIRIENDSFFSKQDRWRTHAIEISYKEFSIGTYVTTNDPKHATARGEYEKHPKWLDGKVFDSPIYLGYRNGNSISRIGFSHKTVQNLTQNAWHLMLGAGAARFLDYSELNTGPYYYNGFYNSYSLWGR